MFAQLGEEKRSLAAEVLGANRIISRKKEGEGTCGTESAEVKGFSAGGGSVFARVSPFCEPLLSKLLLQQQMRLRLKKLKTVAPSPLTAHSHTHVDNRTPNMHCLKLSVLPRSSYPLFNLSALPLYFCSSLSVLYSPFASVSFIVFSVSILLLSFSLIGLR